MLRPLPWLAATVALSATFLVLGVLEMRDQRRELAAALTITGRVADSYRGGAVVPIVYFHPTTEQEVETTTHVWDKPLPGPGETVAIEVLRHDPGRVVLAGDRFTVADDLPARVIWPLFPAAAFVARAHHVRRVAKLTAAPTTFAMTGALFPPGRLLPHCRLALYPVDAGPGAEPICTAPVLTTGGTGVPSACFPVEVKGVARAGGRVVARAGEVVFWPARRALRTASLPRPARVAAAAPVPLTAVEGMTEPPAHCRPVLKAPESLLLAAALVVLAIVVAVTTTNAGEAERARRRSVPLMAEVVARHGDDYSLTVEFTDPATGSARRARAPVDWPEDHPVGRRYPALLSDSGIRLAREPYDAREPVSWALAGAVVAGCAFARMLLRARRNLALRRGPWHGATAWPIDSTGLYPRLGLGAPGHPLRAVAVLHPLDRPDVAPGASVAAAVAGAVEPGAPGLLRIGNRLVVPVGPLRAPPAPPAAG